MYKIGENEMVFCPYNRYHVVSKLRIQKHIIKCQKNYPDMKLATCFYNYTHRLRPEDMLKHYEICSQKTRMDGSRYSEPFCSTNTSVKNDPYTEKFPDINVKPRVFPEDAFSSSTSQTLHGGDSDSSGSEFAADYPELIDDVDLEDADDDDDDDDLVPLPLPKTISRAFVCVNKEPSNFIPHQSQPRRFGRGKNFRPFCPTAKSKTSDHLMSGHQTMESTEKSKSEDSVVFVDRDSKSNSSSVLEYKLISPCKYLPKECSASITSSMFDDISTLKSVDVISDIESTEDDNGNDGFIFTKFNKYVRI